MRVGAIITCIGLAFSVVAMAPLVLGGEPQSWLWSLAMVTGIGLALVLAGLASSSRARGRYLKEAADSLDRDGRRED